MMYRILAVALLSCAPATVPAAALLHPRLEHLHGGVPASPAALLPAGLTDRDAGPLHVGDGNAMWDPLGAGCIDAADPAAWTIGGLREPEAGALCLAQPCARLLTTDEMESPILGRPLREGEWDLYLTRHAEACTAGAAQEWSDASSLDLLPPETQVWSVPARSPDLALASAAPRSHFGRAFGPGGGSSGGFSGGVPGTPFEDGGTDLAGGNGGGSAFDPGGDGGDGPSQGGAGGGGGGSAPVAQQPLPVPLPASLAMLVAGLAVLRLPRRR